MNDTTFYHCPWCETTEKMIRYHDEEWELPFHDDQKQFEFLMMEAILCGHGWNLMMEKREVFRECFAGFDFKIVANFTDEEVERNLHPASV